MKKGTITRKDVLRQLKADLIGKDSYRGVTLTYSWLANQFGHISLGFIPTLILYSILQNHCSSLHPAFIAALIISITWLLFETYNFLGPLLLNKHSNSKLMYLPSKKDYTFKPAWGNVAFDTFTDLCFFWFGAFSAGLFLTFSWTVVCILIALFLILLYPCSYWFLTKMYLQAAQYPYQFRLSQWDVDIHPDDIKTVTQFLRNEDTGKHLFVFGGRRSGKTSLCVGIATELSIKHNDCFYTTGMKLYNMFFDPDSKLLSDKEALWTWRSSSLMVIDDINPGKPIIKDLVSADNFLNMLDKYSGCDYENRSAVKNKNIIWVLGSKDNEKEETKSWKEMLGKIGVDVVNNVTSISLLDSYLP